MISGIFDTHFHLDPEDDPAGLVGAAGAAGVDYLLAAGAPPTGLGDLLRRLAPFPNVWAAAGVHPHDAKDCPADLAPYRQWLAQPRVRAVGEVGLDYHYNFSPPDVQRDVCRRFLELAVATGQPVILHLREAFDDGYALVRDVLGGRHPFVLHCFSGTPDWAAKFLDLGGLISFTGVITFPKADATRAVLRLVPRERLMFETDSPYLAPVPYRGRRNQPAYLPAVIERAALELDADPAELARVTTANAFRFFRLPPP